MNECFSDNAPALAGALRVSQIEAEQLFLQPNENSNSVAVVVKHMAGNMISRWTDFLTTDGEKPNRNRDDEFENDTPDKTALKAFKKPRG